MPNSFEIRHAVEADASAIHGLIVELAVYQNEPDAVVLTQADLLRDGWGPQPHFTCLVAEDAGEICGFALFHPTYSTWQGRSLYLEDLYVRPALRSKGVGSALLARVAAEALALGCARLDWSVLSWNEQALRVYERIGAKRLDEWIRMRTSGGTLTALAAKSTESAASATPGNEPASGIAESPASKADSMHEPVAKFLADEVSS